MGEVSDEVVEVKMVEKAAETDGGKLTRRKMRRKDAVEGGRDGLVKWERFLPKISLRVLLVETDDSTRQIVSALLRKCNYRVAAVGDGLKAWEMLKGKPQSVDLILTEVDLPSISGYALLTLIMEHDVCKNIPVIMMSTQDSVNTVYKCMLKGAADYLVKPLRRNELRNLWQHVWRRQTSLAPGSSFPVDEGLGQEKPEGASANNSTSNQGNAFQREEHPVIEIGGDDQSSCSRPEMQGESADVEDIPRVSSKEAIDFIGTSFRRNGLHNREESVAKYDSRIELDLSLRRPNTSENHSCGDRPSLHPSSASAFTWYVHRPLQTQCSVSPLVGDQRKNVAASEDDNNIVLVNQYSASEPPPSAQRRNEASFYNSSDSPGPPFINQMNSWPGQGSYPTPVPIIQFPGPNTAHTSVMAPASLSPSPSSVSPHEYSSMFHAFNSKPEGLQERGDPMDIEERRHVSSPTGHSAVGNHCSTNYIDHHHQQQQQLLEKKNEEGYSSSVGKLQQSLQREAALNKFRMKRKERCFEKKVRYESRKKLAEQRPRIKGQFVRQVQSTETSTQEAPQ